MPLNTLQLSTGLLPRFLGKEGLDFPKLALTEPEPAGRPSS